MTMPSAKEVDLEEGEKVGYKLVTQGLAKLLQAVPSPGAHSPPEDEAAASSPERFDLFKEVVSFRPSPQKMWREGCTICHRGKSNVSPFLSPSEKLQDLVSALKIVGRSTV